MSADECLGFRHLDSLSSVEVDGTRERGWVVVSLKTLLYLGYDVSGVTDLVGVVEGHMRVGFDALIWLAQVPGSAEAETIMSTVNG